MFVALPTKAENLAGRSFGQLTALGVVEVRRYSNGTAVMWECRCECGGTARVDATKLRSGHTKSCGCLSKVVSRAKAIRHGMYGTSEYKSWSHLKARCLNPTDAAYEHYGARGITVCERWMKFENFLADMGPKPSAKHTIDRINNDGNYEPGNCRWATQQTQQNNRRDNRLITVEGHTHTVAEWARMQGWDPDRIHRRIKCGFSEVEAVTRPLRA